MSKLYTIPIAPQVATRPRVPRFGKVFYGKKYTAFRKEAEDFLRGYKEVGEPYTCPLEVFVWFYCKKPKSTKLDKPNGDIDNYCKSFFDCILTGNLCEDDRQIVRVIAEKRWEDEHGPRIEFFLVPTT